MANTESWVQLCSSHFGFSSTAVSWPRWLEWEEGHRVFSRRERRKERQSSDLSKHMGVYSDPLQTDVSAAERARKQASTLLLPHLVLFFFFFPLASLLFLFSVSLSPLSHLFVCLFFPSIFSIPSHLAHYLKTLKELWTVPAANESGLLGPIWGHHGWVQHSLTHPQHKAIPLNSPG